jgi:hypothetical protein
MYMSSEPGKARFETAAPHAGPGTSRRLAAALSAAVTERTAGRDPQALEALLTDAAAAVLVLERERVHVRREIREALAEAAEDPAAAREAAAFSLAEAGIEEDIAELRDLMVRARARFTRDRA